MSVIADAVKQKEAELAASTVPAIAAESAAEIALLNVFILQKLSIPYFSVIDASTGPVYRMFADKSRSCRNICAFSQTKFVFSVKIHQNQ